MKHLIFTKLGKVNCTGFDKKRNQHFIQFTLLGYHYDWYLTFPRQ